MELDWGVFYEPASAEGSLKNLSFAVKVFAVEGHTNAAGNPDWPMLPQLTVPLPGKNGEPLGLSFIAGRKQDLKLLAWTEKHMLSLQV